MEGIRQGEGFWRRPVDKRSALLVNSVMEKDNDSCIKVPELLYEYSDHVHRIRNLSMSAKPRIRTWTPAWVLRRIWQQDESTAVQCLREWVHNKRRHEATESLVKELNNQPEALALWNIEKLRYSVVRASGRQEMNLKGTITTMDTGAQINIVALVDSGCTGSCVSTEFVERHKLNKRKLLRPMPVYNADGTRNALGSLEYMVQFKLRIGDHEEIIECGVAGLGKTDIFLGHDWLQYHNPAVDWKKQEMKFSRCPGTCWDRSHVKEPEDEMDPMEPLAEGEKLLAVYIGEQELRTRSMATDIAAKEASIAKKRTLEEVVPRHYLGHRKVFEKETFDELPPRRPWDHAIELIPGSKAVDCKIYPLNRNEQEQLDEFLKENLETGRIQPSKSPMASPFFFVKKKDGKLRPVQDYRRLNEMTIKNRYPLPLIGELIDQLSQATVFSKMDIRWGYNNICIKEGDEWKAAFRTNRGLFEPLVMFFGLTNSPATFQTMMNDIFRQEVAEGWVVIYMDDILVFSKSQEEHTVHVNKILAKLGEHKLSLKPEKCWFDQPQIDFLGLVISQDSIRMEKGKIEAITSWPEPTCKRELQQFLGFINFYRRFVQGFAQMAKPLTKLTGKEEWLWTELQSTAFQGLKDLVAREVVLKIPDDDGQFRVEVDASDFAIGGILSQQGKDEQWRPVAFISKALNDAERNYEIYDKEMLAVMHAFYEWSHYLKGAKEVVEVLTDHQNLTYFRKAQNINRRQARWILDFQDYNFVIKHRSGKSNSKADLLSRRADISKDRMTMKELSC